jgi:uncharacterized protein involved in response to NO
LKPWARDPAVYQAPLRAFYLYGAVGAVVGLLLSGLALVLFAR